MEVPNCLLLLDVIISVEGLHLGVILITLERHSLSSFCGSQGSFGDGVGKGNCSRSLIASFCDQEDVLGE